MFIPNQPKVNQVQGKSRVFLNANDARTGPEGRSQSKLSKASTRQLVPQSDMHFLKRPDRVEPTLNKKVSGTMNSKKALKNNAQNFVKITKVPQMRSGGKNLLNRSVIQKKTTEESLECYLEE